MLTSTKEQARRSLHFSHSIKQNLSIIHKELKHSLQKFNGLKLQQSSCSQSQNQAVTMQQQRIIDQNIILLKNLFKVWDKDQMKSILIYNKLISKSKQIKYYVNPVLQKTLFHSNLWPLMSYFLQNQLKNTHLILRSSKVVDVWYQYIATQEKTLFQKIICNNLLPNINLGEWFRNECLEGLFQKYYSNNRKAFTNFIVSYFLFGLAFIYFQSVFILKKIHENEKKESVILTEKDKIGKINYIQTNYIQKFKLSNSY